MIDSTVLDYLNTQTVCTLSVEMLDGSPHAATVHFAHADDPLMFFFETNRDYRKAQPLLKNEITRASLVVGVDEKNKITFQADGAARLLKDKENDLFREVYLSKFPGKQKKVPDPNALFFTFAPIWWRFTDYTRLEGKSILTSD